MAFGPTMCTNPTAKHINDSGNNIQTKNCKATEKSVS